ncbi:MAG: hypothetical protein ACT4P4_19975 [Betaproteobacteria bacterium]
MTRITRTSALLAVAAITGAAALWAAPGPEPAAKSSAAVRLEPLPGSPAKRVILSARAAERLGIETSPVKAQPMPRKQVVGALVTGAQERAPAPEASSGFGAFAAAVRTAAPPSAAAGASGQAAGALRLRVSLSPGEWERLAKDKPARVFPLATRPGYEAVLLAQPSGEPPREDPRRSMLTVYYLLPDNVQGPAPKQRVRLELELAGGADAQPVVPYGAVHYDAKGAAWVYVSPQPLTYERRRVEVERVVGDLAFLSEAPPAGTAVVSVGAALLYGAEIFGK